MLAPSLVADLSDGERLELYRWAQQLLQIGDRREIHVRFGESEPTSRSPLVLVESFEDSDDDGPWDAVEMLCDPTLAKDSPGA